MEFLGLRPISIRFGSEAIATMLPRPNVLSSRITAAMFVFPGSVGRRFGRAAQSSANRISLSYGLKIDSHSGGMVA